MKSTTKSTGLLASVNIGDSGLPGSDATRITAKIYRLKPGYFECVGVYSSGTNQVYFEENFTYGPWRGRGHNPRSAVAAMLATVDSDRLDAMRRAGREAQYRAEDAIGRGK